MKLLKGLIQSIAALCGLEYAGCHLFFRIAVPAYTGKKTLVLKPR